MNAVEKSRVKNAPLLTGEDRSEFVAWANSMADGSIAAGWQPPYPVLADRVTPDALRDSGAKLVTWARKELNQTQARVAAAAGVAVEDVVALENGHAADSECVRRIAGVLRLNPEVLFQMFGLCKRFSGSYFYERAKSPACQRGPDAPLPT